MTISLFELFKIGVGPSSSHTVGPMVAGRRFGLWLEEHELLSRTAHVEADLYGSLALTGKGHASDTALVAGLAGEIPAETSLTAIEAHWARAKPLATCSAMPVMENVSPPVRKKRATKLTSISAEPKNV